MIHGIIGAAIVIGGQFATHSTLAQISSSEVDALIEIASVSGFGRMIVKQPKKIVVRSYVDEKAPEFYDDVMNAVVADLARSSGVAIEFSETKPVNIALVFAPDIFQAAKGQFRQWVEFLLNEQERATGLDAVIEQKRQDNSGCFLFLGFAKAGNDLVPISIIFTSSAMLKESVPPCLIKMLLTSFGLIGVPKDAKVQSASLPWQKHASLQDFDRRMLRMLYRDDIKMGMAPDEARRVLSGSPNR